MGVNVWVLTTDLCGTIVCTDHHSRVERRWRRRPGRLSGRCLHSAEGEESHSSTVAEGRQLRMLQRRRRPRNLLLTYFINFIFVSLCPSLGSLITALPRPLNWILGAILLREVREGEEKRGRGPTSKEGGIGREMKGKGGKGGERTPHGLIDTSCSKSWKYPGDEHDGINCW